MDGSCLLSLHLMGPLADLKLFLFAIGDEGQVAELLLVSLLRPKYTKMVMEQATAARMHPEYLTTLSQVHVNWLFGGIAELVDNARDAGAKRLDISVKSGRLKKENREVPMLCISDNGAGMNHEDILRMVSFGHKKPDEDDVEQIGRFGVGFKTGSMRIGKDAVVFTQSSETRSIALFSACYNEGKDVLEVPVVTYHRQHGRMEYDLRAHGLDEAKANEKAVIDYSPFHKYGIGNEP